MSEKTGVDLIEEWQTGFFILVGAVIAGVMTGLALNSVNPPYGGVIGLLSGGTLFFLVVSYALYGR